MQVPVRGVLGLVSFTQCSVSKAYSFYNMYQ